MNLMIIAIIGILLIGFYAYKHDDMSYRKYYERQVVNSKHPDWTPKCGVNFLEKDPKWFVDNGYGDYVR